MIRIAIAKPKIEVVARPAVSVEIVRTIKPKGGVSVCCPLRFACVGPKTITNPKPIYRYLDEFVGPNRAFISTTGEWHQDKWDGFHGTNYFLHMWGGRNLNCVLLNYNLTDKEAKSPKKVTERNIKMLKGNERLILFLNKDNQEDKVFIKLAKKLKIPVTIKRL